MSVIREYGDKSNYPRVLGRKNVPYTLLQNRGGIPVGRQAMGMIAGETPVHLAQKLRGQVTSAGRGLLQIGRAKIQRLRQTGFRGQILERPAPLINLLKSTFPLVGQRISRYGTIPYGELPGPYPNIPSVYERPGTWPGLARIGSLPSAVGGITGPSRTVHPKAILSVDESLS